MKKYPKPIKPMVITQPWGVYRPDVYQQFGFTRHNGTDYAQTSTALISSPCDGDVVRVDYQPNGGGIFVSVTDGEVLFDFLHCRSVIVKFGEKVKVGQPLAYQDNTGFSTGPHTHIQPRPISGYDSKFLSWVYTVKNDANNSVDPETLWSRDYAEDIWRLSLQVSILQKIIELYKKLKK